MRTAVHGVHPSLLTGSLNDLKLLQVCDNKEEKRIKKDMSVGERDLVGE